MIDRRLLAPAAVSWAACAVIMLNPSIAVAWLPVAAMVVAVACACIAARVRARLPRVVAITGAAAMAATIAASLHIQAIQAEPIATFARDRAQVDVRGVVSGDARATMSVAGGSRWRLRVRAQELRTEAGVMAIDVPIAVFASGEAPQSGAVIDVAGRLSPQDELGDVSATLNATNIAVVGAPDAIAAAANDVRAGLIRALQGVQPDAAALVAGLAVGDESQAPAVLVSDMRESGLSHLTAVSGGNVMIVIGLVLLLGRLLALRTVWRVVLSCAALGFFIAIVRPEPSVLRAVVMGSVSLLALTTGSRSRGIPALCAAVIVLVLLAPGLALSLGFLLSVAATAGLLVLAPSIRRWFDRGQFTARLPEVVRIALSVALAAQIATAAFIVSLGNGLSLVSVPANLLAAPAVPSVTVLGLSAAIASTVCPPLASLLAHCAAPGAWWISWVAHTAAGFPLAVVPWPAGVLGGGLLIAISVAAVVIIRRMRARRIRLPVPLAAALAVTLVVIVTVRPPGAWPPSGWVIVACDVGQGDGLVVRTGEHSAIVVDTGREPVAIARCISDLGIDEVPAVVLTHFHADHVDGLPGVLSDHAVGAVYVSPVRDPAGQAAQVDRWCAEAGLRTIAVTSDDSRAIGALTWRALWPARVIRDGSIPNNASVVLLVEAYGVSMLLTGDVESAAQVAVRMAMEGTPIDVAKVPHHGSRMADAAFPASVHAAVALISVGRSNDYGHPAPGTVALWQESGALVARTDLDGDIAVLTDGTVVRRGVVGQ